MLRPIVHIKYPRLASSSKPLRARDGAQFPLFHRGKCDRSNSTLSRPFENASILQKTGLYDLHLEHGAQMVPFAGYEMPLLYRDLSLSQSHHWTRQKASLFDVGHMVQHRISGSTAERFLSLFTPTDLTDLKPMHSTLSCLLHPSGGIVDDTVITRLGPESFYLVTNAACRDKDVAFISQQLSRLKAVDQPHWEILEHQGLLAVQGPLSASILQKVLADSGALTLPDLYFGQCVEAKLRLISGKETLSVLVSRGGYTGEDGFEISIPAEATVAVAQTLLQRGTSDYLRLAGLGARDTLRLEAGMCLYGHDLNDNTTPVEAGLSWIIGKDRRDSSDFNGADVILEQLKPKKAGGGVSKRRIGLVVEGAPAREHATISTVDGEEIGTVTSGCPSPTLGKNIAMGFVKSGFHKVGTSLKVNVRGKLRDSQVVKMPFVPTRYWRQAPGIAPV